MENFSDMLRGVDKKTLQESIKQAQAFTETAEGRKLVDTFKKDMPKDKDALMKMVAQNPEMIKMLESFLKN